MGQLPLYRDHRQTCFVKLTLKNLKKRNQKNSKWIKASQIVTEVVEKTEPREIVERLFAMVNGDNIIVNNATMLVVGVVAIGLVGLLSYILLQRSDLLSGLSNRNDQEYYYPEEGFYSEEDPGFQTRYKRFAPNDIASKMAQLEQAFKKYQVTEAECEMYIACEASQVNRHEENGPLAKIIFDIISTFNRAKDGHKWDDRMEGLVQAFEYGTGAQAAGQVDACEPLRNKCFELHASTKY